MRKYVVYRHLINGTETFDEFVSSISKIKLTYEVNENLQYGLNLGLKLTFDRNKASNLEERIMKETSDLSKYLAFLIVDAKDKGPGTSYKQILFNTTFLDAPSIVVSTDLDQFITDTEEALEKLNNLVQKVENEGAIYANGSRDVPVVLATNKRNSELRIIHELFHSLAIGSEKLKIPVKKPNTTPAYAEIGESTSGLYVINTAHSQYPTLTESVIKASQIANMKGFATDYYTAIKSSKLGRIVAGYVKSKENKFYTNKSEQEEFKSVERLIREETKELGKTDIRDSLFYTVKFGYAIDKIAQFYNYEDVMLVRSWMLESLRNFD